MSKALRWIVALLVVVLAGLAYWSWRYYMQPPPVAEMGEIPSARPAPSAAPQPPAAEAPIAHPIVAEEAPAVATTTVDSSDKIFADFVQMLFKMPSLPDFVYPDRMLRRFVATVDNLPRQELAARIRPVKPAEGMFRVDKINDAASIAPENDARYERYVNALEGIDVAAAVQFYATHYALFQKAYQDLGYPKGNFNDRLFEAIDDMLATPAVNPPIALVQPKVLYRYADPDLERRSAGQKIMLRMGADNAARVKTVLGRVRAELARYSARH